MLPTSGSAPYKPPTDKERNVGLAEHEVEGDFFLEWIRGAGAAGPN